MLIGKYSSSAHELLLQFLVGRSRSGAEVVDVLSHRGAGQAALEPKGSGEGSSALRQVIARGRGVQVRTAAVCSAVRIGHDGWAVRIRAGDYPQQLALRGPRTASDAGPDRADQGLGANLLRSGQASTSCMRTTSTESSGWGGRTRTRVSSFPVAVRPAPRRSGCRCAIRSAGRPDGRSALPCRSPATAGSRVRRRARRAAPARRSRPS